MKISFNAYPETKKSPDTEPVARELAPAGPRSGPKNGTASQSNGSKLPRHRLLIGAFVEQAISEESGGYFSARSFRALRVLNGASTTNLLANHDGTLPPGSVWA